MIIVLVMKLKFTMVNGDFYHGKWRFFQYHSSIFEIISACKDFIVSEMTGVRVA